MRLADLGARPKALAAALFARTFRRLGSERFSTVRLLSSAFGNLAGGSKGDEVCSPRPQSCRNAELQFTSDSLALFKEFAGILSFCAGLAIQRSEGHAHIKV